MQHSILQITMLSQIKLYLVSFILEHVLRFIFWTCKWEVVGHDILQKVIKKNRPVLLSVWHGRMLFPIFYLYRNSIKWSTLASRHRDAEIIVRILDRLGFELIRGSSSSGSKKALDSIISTFKSNGRVAVTCDGPKGPIYKAKPGAIITALEHNALIITMSGSSKKSWVLNSWDRLMIPKPFSRLVINISEPLDIESTSKSEVVLQASDYISANQIESDRIIQEMT